MVTRVGAIAMDTVAMEAPEALGVVLSAFGGMTPGGLGASDSGYSTSRS